MYFKSLGVDEASRNHKDYTEIHENCNMKSPCIEKILMFVLSSSMISGKQSHALLEGGDNLERSIMHWLDKGDVKNLEKLVLLGFGDLLLGLIDDVKHRASIKFLRQLPAYQNKIDAIHQAVECHNLLLLKELVQRQKFALARDRSGSTILHKAVINNDLSIIFWLLNKYPQIIDAQDHNKRTALHYVAVMQQCQDDKVYQFLINAGASLDIVDCNGCSPRDYIQKPDLLDRSTLRCFCSKQNHNLSHEFNYLLSLWLREGRVTKLAQLVFSGCGDLLLGRHSSHPSSQAFLQEVSTYLEKIAAIHEAIENGDLEQVKILLTAKKWAIARNRFGATPLHTAVASDKEDILRYILEKYPETINSKDYKLRTPLHYAIGKGEDNCCYQALKEAEADPNVIDCDGHKPEFYLLNPQKLSFNFSRMPSYETAENSDVSSLDSLDNLELCTKSGQEKEPIKPTLVEHERTSSMPPFVEFRLSLTRNMPLSPNVQRVLQTVGIPLTEALIEITTIRPMRPISYIATFLKSYRQEAEMVHYNFKCITVVPTAQEMKEIFLSKTQRKTPTVVHRHYAISRIREFYSRKVKFMQQTVHDKLTLILDEFPKLDEIHPFYADLINILYDRDHYKIALGQINTARHLVDNVGKEYTRMMKFGDSLYRCKMLKRAALGRMVKIISRQKQSFVYLEQVRQHLSRLPSIDPNTRTLIICGFPNVGKSSLINKLTRADVEVQPYAFTTKSLYVGHMDYKYLRWQVIDTPGILDQPLEERNTIEMQAITALAHIHSAVVYIMDISEQCHYGLEEQITLFESIRPLFVNKPVLIGLNKVDVLRKEELPEEKLKLLKAVEDAGFPMFSISTVTLEGIMDLRNEACDRLLVNRIDAKLSSKKSDSILNRLQVAMPPNPNNSRPPFIPEAVQRKRMAMLTDQSKERKLLECQIEAELGDDYTLDLKKNYLLPDEWKYDKIPEIWEGHNIADFVDQKIVENFEACMKEEELREKAGLYDECESDTDDESAVALKKQAALIRKKQMLIMKESRERRSHQKPRLPRQGRKRERSVVRLKEEMQDRGLHIGNKRMHHLSESSVAPKAKRIRRDSSAVGLRGTSISRDQKGIKDETMREKAQSLVRKSQKKFQRKALFMVDLKTLESFGSEKFTMTNQRKVNILYMFTAILGLATVALIIALIVVLQQHHESPSPTTQAPTTTSKPEPVPQRKICMTSDCQNSAKNLLLSMNPRTDPCDDFYEYACGSWIKLTKIPDAHARISAFTVLNDENVSKLRKHLDEFVPSSNTSKSIELIKTVYDTCLDEQGIENAGVKPLIDFHNELFKNVKKESVEQLLINMLLKYGLSTLVIPYISADEKNTSVNLLSIDQSWLALGYQSEDYYLKNDTNSVRIRNAYLELIKNVTGMFFSENVDSEMRNIEDYAQSILDFEIQLASINTPSEERRDPDSMYHKVNVEMLNRITENFNWTIFLSAFQRVEEVNVISLDYLKRFDKLLANTPKERVVNYLSWRFILSRLHFLERRYSDLFYNFLQIYRGQKRDSRHSFCINYIMGEPDDGNVMLGYALGKLFVEKEGFTEEIKKELNWMDDQTKEFAKVKADNMISSVAYPDFIIDQLDQYYHDLLNDKSLDEKSAITKEDLFITMHNKIASWLIHQNIAKLSEPFDRNSFGGSPAVVNAWYSPTKNSIVFPAGILQPPFYSANTIPAVNFGSIGATIGHEITHGFDDQGAQYDSYGNLKNWWSNTSREAFNERAQCIVDQYSSFCYPNLGENVCVKGVNTKGENIADNGGIKEAFNAYKMYLEEKNIEEEALPALEYLSGDQVFFLSFANFWCGKSRDSYLKNQIATNEHAPGRDRVIGSLMNFDQFAKAFNCPLNSKMNPPKRCSVW
ncbi:Nucleolar GTP-binding protein 1 [Trichinella murrelli]|uniref:Nucleolar GTP-binding protein 1 n=1 Tax=Trichinella murrelli TaxID=144512 RepID=A0A0V0UIE0_9BILA|nr:Nucleolar GTP-binding protein 1 [Trichinella murrelli]